MNFDRSQLKAHYEVFEVVGFDDASVSSALGIIRRIKINVKAMSTGGEAR